MGPQPFNAINPPPVFVFVFVFIYLLPNYSRITRFDNDNEQIDHEQKLYMYDQIVMVKSWSKLYHWMSRHVKVLRDMEDY